MCGAMLERFDDCRLPAFLARLSRSKKFAHDGTRLVADIGRADNIGQFAVDRLALKVM